VTTEQRLVAGIEQIKGEVIGLGRSQQGLFAMVDSLAKILLTCIPEPDGHALAAAVARAQRSARPIVVEKRGSGDGQRFAAGHAGVGEKWRTMRSGSFGIRRESHPSGGSAVIGYRLQDHHALGPDERRAEAPVFVRLPARNVLGLTGTDARCVSFTRRTPQPAVANPWALSRA
jgi:hypothetical protein